MNPDVFADWLVRQGHRVVRTASSYWYDAAPGVFQAFPYHWVITPVGTEIQDLMLRHGVVAVRYSAPIGFHRGLASYHVILQKPYTLDMLKAQARNGVKMGMSRFAIQQISFERLATEGWALQRDTLDRQGRLRSMNREGWERLCRAARDLTGFEAWAAVSPEGELAAAVIAARLEDKFSVPFALSHRRFQGEHVNNALFFGVSQELLQREGVESLFFTVQSLDDPANVDEFKFRMGLQIKLVRQCVDFHPLLRPLATSAVHRWVRRLFDRDPSSPFLAKAEGMLRFHLEGRRPLEEQAWPERLQAERSRLAPAPEVLRKEKGFQVTSATPLDVRALADLHWACFTRRENLSVLLGRPFLLAAYRWFVGSPGTFVLVARQGDRIVGFTAVSDRPYLLPLAKACRRDLVRGYLRHPWAVFDRRVLRRLRQALAPQAQADGVERVAQVAYTAVDPGVRGQGIGRALKEASIGHCRTRGWSSLSTGVRRQNLGALRLNMRAGFVEVPVRSTPWMVYLRLDLGGAPASESAPRSARVENQPSANTLPEQRA